MVRGDNQLNIWLHRFPTDRSWCFKNGSSVARRRVTNEGQDQLSLRPVTGTQTLHWHRGGWSDWLQCSGFAMELQTEQI